MLKLARRNIFFLDCSFFILDFACFLKDEKKSPFVRGLNFKCPQMIKISEQVFFCSTKKFFSNYTSFGHSIIKEKILKIEWNRHFQKSIWTFHMMMKIICNNYCGICLRSKSLIFFVCIVSCCCFDRISTFAHTHTPKPNNIRCYYLGQCVYSVQCESRIEIFIIITKVFSTIKSNSDQ